MKSFVPQGSYEDIRMQPGVLDGVYTGVIMCGGEVRTARDGTGPPREMRLSTPVLVCLVFSIKTSDFRWTKYRDRFV